KNRRAFFCLISDKIFTVFCQSLKQHISLIKNFSFRYFLRLSGRAVRGAPLLDHGNCVFRNTNGLNLGPFCLLTGYWSSRWIVLVFEVTQHRSILLLRALVHWCA